MLINAHSNNGLKTKQKTKKLNINKLLSNKLITLPDNRSHIQSIILIDFIVEVDLFVVVVVVVATYTATIVAVRA